jgi:hypothetical protein
MNRFYYGAGAATAVWGVWTAIELGFRRHRAIPSRDWDTFGIAGSYLEISDDLRRAQRDIPQFTV